MDLLEQRFQVSAITMYDFIGQLRLVPSIATISMILLISLVEGVVRD